MKILSRMLSKKIDPQNADEMDFDLEREALDDAGQVRPARPARPSSKPLSQPLSAKPEEPEVAGSGWATEGDWDDDWDDDEDWGAEDDPAADIETRRQTQDKQHLVTEIREAMTSVSHSASAEPEEGATSGSGEEGGASWAEDEQFGRRALARSQLTEASDETEERLMEKTEDVMSDRETSRRRSALAHMKAAAAATKADRVLRQVASHDGAADSEEQSPYRDDLAKVVRPHSTSRPISRQVSRVDAPTPIWDQGAADEDAALFAAAENGMQDDPAEAVDSEMSAAEDRRLSRSPIEMSAEDFIVDDEDKVPHRARSDFPSSRFAVPPTGEGDDTQEDMPEDDDFERAAEDIAAQSRANDEFDDPFEDEFEDDFEEEDASEDDDDVPLPSTAVGEAIAFATAPDEEEEPQQEVEVRKKIWEMADEVAAEVESSRNLMRSQPQPAKESAPDASAPSARDAGGDAPADNMFEVSTALAGRAGRSAGRVKTRLLGFQAEDDQKDVFASGDQGRAPVEVPKFPTGWIVVIDGPGRGSSFSLHAGVSQIGRGEDQTVRLDFGDTSISRNNHAAVAFDEEQGTFFLGHGGKSNLVRLNGKPVLSTEEMTNGDEIRIGETSLKFIALCGDNFTWTGKDGANGEDA